MYKIFLPIISVGSVITGGFLKIKMVSIVNQKGGL